MLLSSIQEKICLHISFSINFYIVLISFVCLRNKITFSLLFASFIMIKEYCEMNSCAIFTEMKQEKMKAKPNFL